MCDREHYDNQRVNGLTFPRVIRSSAFTQKLDIEGCYPLALPVEALLYQQASNHWLRKLAHGRGLCLIPTWDFAAVVFATELLSQLRNRGIDLDRVSQVRARQDGTLDKTSNTKYAAQIIAEHIQGWLPVRSILSTRSHNSKVSWQNYVNDSETNPKMYPLHPLRVNKAQHLVDRQFAIRPC